jgi:hypothetical protein
MEMRGFFMVCGDLMNINVEDMIEDWAHINQAGFLARLTPRGAEHVGIVFDVSAGLYPDAEPGVVCQQRVRTILINYPGRAGQMAGPQISVETGFIAFYEIQDSFQPLALARVKWRVRAQLS